MISYPHPADLRRVGVVSVTAFFLEGSTPPAGPHFFALKEMGERKNQRTKQGIFNALLFVLWTPGFTGRSGGTVQETTQLEKLRRPGSS